MAETQSQEYLIEVCCIGCLSNDVQPVKADDFTLMLYNGLILNIEDDSNFKHVCITFCQQCQDLLRKFAEFKKQCIDSKLLLQRRVLEEVAKRPEFAQTSTSEPLLMVSIPNSQRIKIEDVDEINETEINLISDDDDLSTQLGTEHDGQGLSPVSDKAVEAPPPAVEAPVLQPSIKEKKHKPKNKNHPDYMICHFCGEEFLNRNKIVAHLRRLHLGYSDAKIRILCLICDIPIDRLRKHVFSKHQYTDQDQICCQSCSYRGTNKTMLFRHFERLHTAFERPKRCPQCNERFQNNRDLSNHQTRTHQRLSCQLCGFETKQIHMEYHVKVKHEGKKGCAVCRSWFELDKTYVDHMKVHRERSKTVDAKVCNECGYTTKHPTSFRDHLRQHRSKSDEASQYRRCKVCDKDCGTYFALKLHMTTEHKPKTVKCDHCDLTFFSEVRFL